MQQQFDFTGPHLALVGQQLAIDHANSVIDNWSAGAYKLLLDYIKMYGSQPFKAEQVREWAEEMEYPVPPSKRAWGSIFQRAKIDGIIESTGIVKTVNPKAHSAYATQWRRV